MAGTRFVNYVNMLGQLCILSTSYMQFIFDISNAKENHSKID